MENSIIKYREKTSEFGFIQIPTLLLQSLKKLTLTRSETIVLFSILAHQFSEGRAHHWASLREISKETGFSIGTTHKAKKGLVDKGFLKSKKEEFGWAPNIYDPTGMLKKLEDLACEIIHKRKS